MIIRVDRKWKKDTYTIGKLYINGTLFSDTLEDKDRGLTDTMSLEEIKSKKVYGDTAIPAGTYTVKMDTVSPKYSTKPWYVQNCNKGRMPRIMGIKGFSGVLIHPGNSNKDTYGCLLVGKNSVKGGLTESKATFLKLYNRLYEAYKRKEEIKIIFE